MIKLKTDVKACITVYIKRYNNTFKLKLKLKAQKLESDEVKYKKSCNKQKKTLQLYLTPMKKYVIPCFNHFFSLNSFFIKNDLHKSIILELLFEILLKLSY